MALVMVWSGTRSDFSEKYLSLTGIAADLAGAVPAWLQFRNSCKLITIALYLHYIVI